MYNEAELFRDRKRFKDAPTGPYNRTILVARHFAVFRARRKPKKCIFAAYRHCARCNVQLAADLGLLKPTFHPSVDSETWSYTGLILIGQSTFFFGLLDR